MIDNIYIIIITDTGADRYTTMKRMVYNNSRWKAANQSKD